LTARRLPDMHVPHHSSGVAASGGKVYVWSGYSTVTRPHWDRTRVLEVYDPAAKTWTEGARSPGPRNGPGSFALDRRIYSIGGEQSPSGRFSREVHRYNSAVDAWTECRPFPATAWDPLVTVCGGKAYVLGGRHGYGRTYPHVYVYDEERDQWNRKNDMPHSVMSAGIASCDRKIYVFGGTHKKNERHGEELAVVQIYDPEADSWATREMPRTLYRAKAVVHDDRIWIFAWKTKDESTGKAVPYPFVLTYSPAGNKWGEHPFDCPPGAQFSSPVALIDGQAYLTDFYDGQTRLRRAYAVDLTSLHHRPKAPAAAKAGGWRYPSGDRFRTGVNRRPNRLAVSMERANGLKLSRVLMGGSLLIGDLDGHGRMECVVADGRRIMVRGRRGREIWTREFDKAVTLSFLEDVDESPGLEIVGSCNDQTGESRIFVLSSHGKILKSIPFQVNREGISPRQICDLDGDGRNEIIAIVGSGYGRRRRGIWVFDYDSGREKWRFEIGPQPGNLIVDDVNGDGRNEILLGMGSPHNGNEANGYSDHAGSWIICFTHTGKVLWDAKLGTWGLSPIYADVDGDGTRELVVYRNQDYYGGNATVYLLDPRTGKVKDRYDGKADDACWEGVVGDMDGDGKMEIYATFGARERCLHALNSAMKPFATLPKVEMARAAGDLCGDRQLELVTVERGGAGFHVRDRELKALWSGRVPRGNASGAMIYDLDGDGMNELIIQTAKEFWVYSMTPREGRGPRRLFR
jgi:N-acetylneuraminic acid mutarotase/outer membrane protein assembly factor BamB